MSNIDVELFVKKWLTVFSDNNMDFLDVFEKNNFPKDCEDFGFEMDCGNKFVETYGTEMMKGNNLENDIERINDIMILGSGIFSNWRYFNHWAYCRPTEEDIKWFILAFKRLIELTKE